MSKEKFTKGKWVVVQHHVAQNKSQQWITGDIDNPADRDLIGNSKNLYCMVKKMQVVINKLDPKNAILGDAEILLMEARGE